MQCSVSSTQHLLKIFSEPQNPGFIIKGGFKSTAGYDGTRMIFKKKSKQWSLYHIFTIFSTTQSYKSVPIYTTLIQKEK